MRASAPLLALFPHTAHTPPLPPPPCSALEKGGAAAAVEDEDEDEEEEEDGKDESMNRAEKKARKAITKLGLKVVTNVERVVVKRGRTSAWVITRPDVYKVPGSDTYCIFGHAVEDSSAAAASGQDLGRVGGGASAQQDFARLAAQVRQSVAAPTDSSLEESTDETGLEAKDIELVMGQASVSRGRAVAALKKCSGDIVNAIM